MNLLTSLFCLLLGSIVALKASFAQEQKLLITSSKWVLRETVDTEVDLTCSGLDWTEATNVIFKIGNLVVYNSADPALTDPNVQVKNQTIITNTSINLGISKASCQFNAVTSNLITVPYIKKLTFEASTSELSTNVQFNVTCSVEVEPKETLSGIAYFVNQTKVIPIAQWIVRQDGTLIWNTQQSYPSLKIGPGPDSYGPDFTALLTPVDKYAAQGEYLCQATLSLPEMLLEVDSNRWTMIPKPGFPQQPYLRIEASKAVLKPGVDTEVDLICTGLEWNDATRVRFSIAGKVVYDSSDPAATDPAVQLKNQTIITVTKITDGILAATCSFDSEEVLLSITVPYLTKMAFEIQEPAVIGKPFVANCMIEMAPQSALYNVFYMVNSSDPFEAVGQWTIYSSTNTQFQVRQTIPSLEATKGTISGTNYTALLKASSFDAEGEYFCRAAIRRDTTSVVVELILVGTSQNVTLQLGSSGLVAVPSILLMFVIVAKFLLL